MRIQGEVDRSFHGSVRQRTKRLRPLRHHGADCEYIHSAGLGEYYKRAHVRKLFNVSTADPATHLVASVRRWRNAGWKRLPAAQLMRARACSADLLIPSLHPGVAESRESCQRENRTCSLAADGGQRASAPPPTDNPLSNKKGQHWGVRGERSCASGEPPRSRSGAERMGAKSSWLRWRTRVESTRLGTYHETRTLITLPRWKRASDGA